MKRLKYIRFTIPDGKEQTTRQILHELGFGVPSAFEGQGDTFVSRSHALTVEEDSEKLGVLLSKLQDAMIDPKPFVRSERHYAQQELADADLFWIHVTRQKDDGYTTYGTHFGGQDCCPKCGSGTRQLTELVVNCSRFGKTHFAATYNLELIVSVPLAKTISDSCVGFDLRPVTDFKTQKTSKEYLQFIPNTKLPPLVPPSRMVRSSAFCEKCGRNGVFLDSEMHINAIVERSDAYATREFFGEMRERTCPGPELVLSSKLVNKIRELDRTAIEIEPVFQNRHVVKRPMCKKDA